MALNANVLGSLMQQKVQSIGVSEDPTSYFVALAAAVIEHLQVAGVISTTVNTTVATTGTAAAQTGAGVGSGTGKIS